MQDCLKSRAIRVNSGHPGAHAGISSADAQAKHFIRLWTLKEAHVKATGRGILAAPGMSAFSIDIQELSNKCSNNAQPPGSVICMHPNDDWDFVLLQMGQEHVAALCVQRKRCNTSNGSFLSSDKRPLLQTPVRLHMWTVDPAGKDQRLSDFHVIATS